MISTTRLLRALPAFVALAAGPLHATDKPAASDDASAFLAAAQAGFPAWDADSDGKLTPIELDLALASPKVKGDSAAAAAALRRASRARPEELQDYTLAGLPDLVAKLNIKDTRDDEEARDNADTSAANANTLVRYFRDARKRIATAPAELFVGKPDASTLKQGRLGSCFSLAPLLAVGFSDPDALAAHFDPRPDGTVRVRYGKDDVISVPPLTDGELALATTTTGNGRWAAVYEKGAGMLRMKASPPKGPATPHSVVTRGGSAGAMLATFTGQDIKRFSCRDWLPGKEIALVDLTKKLDDLRGQLESTFAAGRLATAGTSKKTVKVPSLSQNHAYAVIGYDRATDLITFRDPHGQTFDPKGAPSLANGYPVKRGVFQAPVSDAVRFMAGFAFQTGTGDGSAPAPVVGDTDA